MKEDDEQLIRVFSSAGNQLGTIGQPVSTGVEGTFNELAQLVSRETLFVDDMDQIYWLGYRLPSPTIRKYNAKGELLLEFQPDGPNIKTLSFNAKSVF